MDKTSVEYHFGTKCVYASLRAVKLADLLHKGLHLNEAYFSTIDVLAFAAMTLLVVELGSSDSSILGEAIKSGKRAKELLLMLSLQSQTAAECWEALSVCWKSELKKSPPPADTSPKPVHQAGKSTPSRSTSLYATRRPGLKNLDSGIGMSESPTVSPTMTQLDNGFTSNMMDGVVRA